MACNGYGPQLATDVYLLAIDSAISSKELEVSQGAEEDLLV